MATADGFNLNGWQRAALLIAGLAVAVGTADRANQDGGMSWVIGALIATALVVVGLKGVTSGRGPVLTVLTIVTALVLATIAVAHVSKVQELSAERDAFKKAEDDKAAKDRIGYDQSLRLMYCTFDAALIVARSHANDTVSGETFLAEFERERVARERKFYDEERAAGREVNPYYKLGDELYPPTQRQVPELK